MNAPFSFSLTGLVAVAGLLLAAPAVRAQAPAWQTAVALGTPVGSTSSVFATAADAGGNVFLAGSFSGTATFGATTLTSAGNEDLFVAKWSPTTGFVWAQRAGGTSYDVARALAVSGTSVYVVGSFNSPAATFGATTLTNASVGGGYPDVFVAKLTDAGPTGAWVWAQQAGGFEQDAAIQVAVSGSSVYVAGAFASATAAFGATTLTNARTGGGWNDGFVAKLTDAGPTSAWAWAHSAGGVGVDLIEGLAVSGASVYISGSFASPTASFGAITLANTDASGVQDVFVAKLTDAGPLGSWTWAQPAGGPGSDFGAALAVQGSSLYLTGGFASDTAHFGPLALNATTHSSDVFVARLTDAGSTSAWQWVQQAGGGGGEAGSQLAVRGSSIYVTGNFTGSAATFGPTTLTAAGNSDVFVARLLDAGSTATWQWAQPAGGSNNDYTNALTLSGSSVYVAGSFFSPTASFGSLILTNGASGGVFQPTGFLAVLTDTTLATPRALDRPAFTLAPNPAHAAVQLSGTWAGPVQLLDGLGRVVRSLPLAAQSSLLDLRGLPPGLYLVRCSTATRRLVVE